MHKDLKVFCTKVGDILTNCYVIYDIETNDGIMIDPGDVSDRLDMIIKPLNIKYILLTHGHFDHIGGVAYYKDKAKCDVVMMREESEFINNQSLSLGPVNSFKADILLEDNDELEFNKYKIKVLATPGHTKGGCCYIIENYIFTGDTLFEGSVGRIDFPTGSFRNLKASLARLKSLKTNYSVYPGHGEITRLNYEKSTNPYLQKV
ncbi:MAG: MBL fold metallo-hydrolase [Clostridia bacterium]|nr:MBL fold metallo-hydrolase [Clostridia bacterium]